MLDNLQIIPSEAFTATEQFSEKLLDKISNAIGWAVIPKNTKKYRLEAEEYLIEQIKNDEKIPVLVKAAYISKVRKLIKEYVNKCDICLKAMDNLASNANCDKEKNVENIENIENIEDDWLEFFFDRAKDIAREDMQVVWAKLLEKLANYCISVDGKDAIIIYYDLMHDFYNENGLIEEEILHLEDIGLLQSFLGGYEYTLETDQKVTYFGKELEFGKGKKIYTGNVILSRAGEELMSILTEREQIEGYEEILIDRIDR